MPNHKPEVPNPCTNLFAAVHTPRLSCSACSRPDLCATRTLLGDADVMLAASRCSRTAQTAAAHATLLQEPALRSSADNPRLWQRMQKTLARVLCTAACEWGACGRTVVSPHRKLMSEAAPARNSHSRPCGRRLSAFPRADFLRHAAGSNMRVRQVLSA